MIFNGIKNFQSLIKGQYPIISQIRLHGRQSLSEPPWSEKAMSAGIFNSRVCSAAVVVVLSSSVKQAAKTIFREDQNEGTEILFLFRFCFFTTCTLSDQRSIFFYLHHTAAVSLQSQLCPACTCSSFAILARQLWRLESTLKINLRIRLLITV